MSTSKRNDLARMVHATKEYYESYAKQWSDTRTNSFHHEPEFRRLVSLLSPRAKIVDIGCASGIHVPLFLGIGWSCTYAGIDISRSFLKIAKRRYPQLRFLAGNIADRDSLPKEHFDGFLAVAVLMHVPRELWDTAFSNLESILKPHAYGYITLPIEHPSGERADSDRRHFTLMDEVEQIKYLRGRGWKIIRKTRKLGSGKSEIWRGYIVLIP